MTKVGRPQGLIRYASLNSIERGERFRFTARLRWYTTVLVALAGVLAWLVFTRTEVETTLLRAPGALFQQTPAGSIENLYTVKLVNKTTRDIPVQFTLDNVPGTLRVMGGHELVVPKANLTQAPILVEIPATTLHGANLKLRIGVFSRGKRIKTLETTFIGPRANNP